MTSASQILLRGITWNHTRGYLPMVATAQRFSELHPEVAIQWQVRSLQAFADEPLAELAQSFDLLVIDHPSIGFAAEAGLLVALDDHLPTGFLADQAQNSAGGSHASYKWKAHQWALAIDAATPVSGWRADLLARANAEVPETWEQLLALARRGLVAVPGLAIDSLMNVYMLAVALGEEPFLEPSQFISEATGLEALRMLRSLVSACHPSCLARNPIAIWEELANGDRIAYCPFAYGYSNYSRSGYAKHPLAVGGLVSVNHGRRLRSTMGGAGLAVSRSTAYLDLAVQYAEFTASSAIQSTLYFDAGGQPGHRSAWTSDEVNRRSNQFFSSTLSTLDAAYVRPRFPGYLDFQDSAAPVVHAYLTAGGDERAVIRKLNFLLAQLTTGQKVVID
ncbi:MAG: extracellular solute-binding protein [Terracidiphilus sp.]